MRLEPPLILASPEPARKICGARPLSQLFLIRHKGALDLAQGLEKKKGKAALSGWPANELPLHTGYLAPHRWIETPHRRHRMRCAASDPRHFLNQRPGKPGRR